MKRCLSENRNNRLFSEQYTQDQSRKSTIDTPIFAQWKDINFFH